MTTNPDDARPRVVVVGAGIAGLSAAAALARDGRVSVTVLEGSPRVGGKLMRGEVGGVVTDLGAEAVLARRPEGVALIDSLGLSAEVVYPAVLSSAVWSRGALRSLSKITSCSLLSGSTIPIPAYWRTGKATISKTIPAS